MESLEKLKQESYQAATEILEAANIKKGQLFVVGCSTSEVIGGRIGKASSPETAEAVFAGIYRAVQEHEVFLAAQCCEHLNRAVIIEREAVINAQQVNVVPQPKAGGSFATAAYNAFSSPVAVEEISADAGLEIGFTMSGMHIKKVAVPVRLVNNKIGNATVLAARSRPKFIGGIRAVYDETML